MRFKSSYKHLWIPILSLVLLLSQTSRATPRSCSAVLSQEPSVIAAASWGPFNEGLDGRWRKTQGTLYEAMRANAPHHMKSLVETTNNPTIQSLLSVRGTIVGDFHILNFADIELAKHEREIGLVDIDDGGIKAPLINDVSRALVGANIVDLDISLEKAFKAYLQGLRGEHSEKPKLVKKAEDQKESDFKNRQIDWLEKVTHHEKFTDKARVVALDKAPKEVQDLFLQNKEELERSLNGQKILDFGYRSKDGGGSQGLPRFWYLIENKDLPQNLEIIEFKYLGRPAAGLGQIQPIHKLRVAQLVREFRPAEPVYGTYKVVDTPHESFLARTRISRFIDLDLTSSFSKPEKEEIAEYYLYLIQKLGENHNHQLGADNNLKTVLSTEKGQLEFLDWCKNYIELMKKLNQ